MTIFLFLVWTYFYSYDIHNIFIIQATKKKSAPSPCVLASALLSRAFIKRIPFLPEQYLFLFTAFCVRQVWEAFPRSSTLWEEGAGLLWDSLQPGK